jgi:putative methionine-R-sulfoxide reductase with GAF domain
MLDSARLLKRLREILSFSGDRVGKARRISAAIRESGSYRWVGIYDASGEDATVVAWSGPARDPRSRPALVSTRTEIVIPILADGGVVGLLDVESTLSDGFGEEDRQSLEACAASLSPLWR